jgi:hypothetical protein
VDVKNNFLSSLPLDKKNVLVYDVQLDKLDNFYFVKLADWIFVPADKIISFFEKVPPDILKGKKIIVLVSSLKDFYKKILSPYVKKIPDIQLYVYDTDSFLNVVSKIYQ